MPEVSQFRWPTPGSWVSGPVRQFFSSDAAPRAAPPRMSVPAPLAAASVIRLLVVALDRRVGDLEGVEDAHREVVAQVRQDAGHADEADLALGLKLGAASRPCRFSSSVARLGDMCTCTRSRRSVRSLRRDCSTSARTFAWL